MCSWGGLPSHIGEIDEAPREGPSAPSGVGNSTRFVKRSTSCRSCPKLRAVALVLVPLASPLLLQPPGTREGQGEPSVHACRAATRQPPSGGVQGRPTCSMSYLSSRGSRVRERRPAWHGGDKGSNLAREAGHAALGARHVQQPHRHRRVPFSRGVCGCTHPWKAFLGGIPGNRWQRPSHAPFT